MTINSGERDIQLVRCPASPYYLGDFRPHRNAIPGILGTRTGPGLANRGARLAICHHYYLLGFPGSLINEAATQAFTLPLIQLYSNHTPRHDARPAWIRSIDRAFPLNNPQLCNSPPDLGEPRNGNGRTPYSRPPSGVCLPYVLSSYPGPPRNPSTRPPNARPSSFHYASGRIQ